MKHENIHEEINDSCFYLIRKESLLIPWRNVQLYLKTKCLQCRHTQVMATHRVSGNLKNYRLLILEWSIMIHSKYTFFSFFFFFFNFVTFTKNSATLLPGCYLKLMTSFPGKELLITFPILTTFLTQSIRSGQQSRQSLSLEIDIRNNTNGKS